MPLSSSLSKLKIDDFVDGEFPSPTNRRHRDTRSPTAADPLQFFVRILSDHTHLFYADPRDTVRSIHEKIQSITGIPLFEQRLIYLGKQLNWEQTLSECGVKNDAGLHLVGRMRSTGHPQSWQLINKLISSALYLLKNPPTPSFLYITSQKTVRSMLLEFLKMTTRVPGSGHLQIFTASSAPMALVMLYMSSHRPNRDLAGDSIQKFVNSCKIFLPKHFFHQCVPIMMEFCRLLRGASRVEDSLYGLCRSVLGTMVNYIEFRENKGPVELREVFPFLMELAAKLSSDLVKGTELVSFCTIPLWADVNDFITYVAPMKKLIKGDRMVCGPIEFPLREPLCFAGEIISLHVVFSDLLSKMNNCMAEIEVELGKANGRNGKLLNVGGQFFALLKELNCISKLYHGCEEVFWESMKQRKEALCYIIISSAERYVDHNWISDGKKATNFEARRHLAMLLIPEVNDDYDEEMLIDRQDLFSGSFDFIMNADFSFLHSSLFVKFENEEATGPGVLREWFLLVCQEIFNPQRLLFVACPNDHRRFFPNPASGVDPLDHKYFNFAGKVIALALMHKVQVGIMFDRTFFLQLGGYTITLEDIRDADPFLYRSWKHILEMNPDEVDALGLMFVDEIEELGRKREVELFPGGKNVAVNSKNRRQYVESLIQHHFVKRIAEQVHHFAMGFADIVIRNWHRYFFRCLKPGDFDLMISGSEREIRVDDWKAHTKYAGFNETDNQISWFWKIVGGMTNEQKKALLFFWTSIKYLPIEGFSGLGSHLHIYKNYGPSDRLPTSHTCFYRLCFPAYPTMAAMDDCLKIITKEHVSCSFGSW